jgi:hypothetical protein
MQRVLSENEMRESLIVGLSEETGGYIHLNRIEEKEEEKNTLFAFYISMHLLTLLV